MDYLCPIVDHRKEQNMDYLCPDTSQNRKRWIRFMSGHKSKSQKMDLIYVRTQVKIAKDGNYVWWINLSSTVLTSTLVLGINYFAIITRPLHQIQVRKRSSNSCYMIETYNTHHRFPCYWTMSSHNLNGVLWYFQRMLPELQLLTCTPLKINLIIRLYLLSYLKL